MTKIKYITITEAAHKSGLSRQWIHKLIQSERIDAVRIGNTYAIPYNFIIHPLMKETRGRKKKK